MKYDYGIYIGRFQPWHLGHYGRLMNGLLYCDKVIILIGSSSQSRTVKNPFKMSERVTMILGSLPDVGRVQLCGIDDYSTDEEWLNSIEYCTKEIIPSTANVVLLGAQKDDYTKAYLIQILERFKWAWQSEEVINTLSATIIRDYLFGNRYIHKDFLEPLRVWVPESTYKFLEDFIKTPEFLLLKLKYKEDLYQKDLIMNPPSNCPNCNGEQEWDGTLNNYGKKNAICHFCGLIQGE
jgi:bifunctional NMN adenylyltransferase/nudix hydrolase